MGHPINYYSHNWLIKKTCNRLIIKHKLLMKGTVYDLGCGERPFEKEILSYGCSYIGVDWSETLHDLKADIIADLNKQLPIENEVADTVTSFQVMEHLSEPLIFLNEANRILKKGGAMILTVPFQWWVHEAPYDFYRYTPYGLKYLLNKSGFSSINIKPYAGFFTTWILKMNYFSMRFVRGPKILRFFIRSVLILFWSAGQLLAPLLDKLDRSKELEAPGYIVTAIK